MKKVFIVVRTDEVDYDEYDSCVIVADSVEEVEYMILNSKTSYWDNGFRKIKEIDLENCESMELVASFNAG